MSRPEPGWYADPGGSAEFRWWDGRRWTDALSPDREARPPAHATPAGPVGHRRPLRPVALALALSLLALVSIGVGTHLIGPRPESRTSRPAPATDVPLPAGPSGSDLQAGAWSTATSGSLNEETRIATIGRGTAKVTMQLPDAPYELVPQPKRIGEAFDVAFVSNAVVHPAAADRPTWVSTVALAHVSAKAASSGAPTVVASAAVAGLLDAFFPAGPVGLLGEKVASCMVTGGEPARTVTGRVAYRVPGLPSRFDRLTVLLVGLDDGSYVVAVSTVPDDAPAEHTSLAAAALATLAVG